MSDPRADRPSPLTLHRYALGDQLIRLRADTPIRVHGRDSLTLVRGPVFTLILMALNAGSRLSEHKAPGPITVLVLDGRVAFSAQGERLELGPHDLITLPAHILHEVDALEDCAILVSIAAPVTRTDPKGLESEHRQGDYRPVPSPPVEEHQEGG
ncbi:cupin domain-containing protein [Deinococcus sp.]|uniref:cupin domain-containing protein n=1 Tax=Deinococcus sp. TaxID=47478 RepID=UPI00286E99D0|nr:cupin domain-containing protein [Deinococcus sp.]